LLGELLLNRRIDDRIRELSDQAVTASNGEVEPILKELLAVVREKLHQIRKMAATHIIEGKHLQDRRSTDAQPNEEG
jgi:hypothetical protein